MGQIVEQSALSPISECLLASGGSREQAGGKGRKRPSDATEDLQSSDEDAGRKEKWRISAGTSKKKSSRVTSEDNSEHICDVHPHLSWMPSFNSAVVNRQLTKMIHSLLGVKMKIPSCTILQT